MIKIDESDMRMHWKHHIKYRNYFCKTLFYLLRSVSSCLACVWFRAHHFIHILQYNIISIFYSYSLCTRLSSLFFNHFFHKKIWERWNLATVINVYYMRWHTLTSNEMWWIKKNEYKKKRKLHHHAWCSLWVCAVCLCVL